MDDKRYTKILHIKLRFPVTFSQPSYRSDEEQRKVENDYAQITAERMLSEHPGWKLVSKRWYEITRI